MATLEKSRRRAVEDTLPPIRCSARSSRTGQPCQRWAVVGASVCYTHGGTAPQVAAKAEERITLAERLATAPKRQPWEVLEDAAHISDVLMQDARLSIQAGSFTPEALDKLVGALDRAHRLSTSNVHAGLAERRQRFAEAQAQTMHRFAEAQAQTMHRFVMAVLNGLALTAEQKALVPAVVKREIEGVLVRQGEIAA